MERAIQAMLWVRNRPKRIREALKELLGPQTRAVLEALDFKEEITIENNIAYVRCWSGGWLTKLPSARHLAGFLATLMAHEGWEIQKVWEGRKERCNESKSWEATILTHKEAPIRCVIKALASSWYISTDGTSGASECVEIHFEELKDEPE